MCEHSTEYRAGQRQTVDGQRGPQYVPRRQFDAHDVAFSEFEIRIDKHFQPAVTRTAGQNPCATTATGSAARAHGSGFDVNDRTNAGGGPGDCDYGALRVIHDALPAQTSHVAATRRAYWLRRTDFAICSTVICGTWPTAVTRYSSMTVL